MQKHTRHLLGLAIALSVGTGCDDPQGGRGRGVPSGGGKSDCTGMFCEEQGLPTGPLEDAFCEIEVLGHGSVDTETEYLANVIFCENGQADLEALKAMAIAARSVAYWEMGVNGDICDDDHCQVFSCDGEPSAIHFRAVEETSGMYLFFEDEVTYGFYVLGSETSANSLCEPLESEDFVTHNLGRTGDDVEQTELGWVSDPTDEVYGQNRGCMSQLGMQCLEGELGYDYEDILRYYYGADIQIGQAQGDCVKEVDEDPDPEPDMDGSTSDASDSDPETASDSDPETASASDSDPDSASASESDSDSDGRPPRPTDSDTASASDTATASDSDSESDSASASDTEASSASDTDTDTDAAMDTESADTEANDTEAPSNDTDDDESDPYGSSEGGDWPDDDYEPGGEPTPWGDDAGSDTDTDTDGGADSQRSGCSVSGAGGGEPPAFALGLLVLGLIGRRKRGPAPR